jgi:hypothetical protein
MHLHACVPNGGRVEFNVAGWQLGATLFDGTPREGILALVVH